MVEKKKRTKGTIDVNHNLCTGCRICEVACSLKHENIINPALSRIRIYQFFPGPIDIPVLCHRCLDHPCVDACPLSPSAIFVNEETGAIMIDESSCIGETCGMCAKACRHGGLAITFHSSKSHALVCDLCDGDPECVKVCSNDVLNFIAGSTFDGLHYAISSPEEIAKSISYQFYPAKGDID